MTHAARSANLNSEEMGNTYSRLVVEREGREPRETRLRELFSFAPTFGRAASKPRLPEFLQERMAGGEAARREPTSLKHSDTVSGRWACVARGSARGGAAAN